MCAGRGQRERSAAQAEWALCPGWQFGNGLMFSLEYRRELQATCLSFLWLAIDVHDA